MAFWALKIRNFAYENTQSKKWEILGAIAEGKEEEQRPLQKNGSCHILDEQKDSSTYP